MKTKPRFKLGVMMLLGAVLLGSSLYLIQPAIAGTSDNTTAATETKTGAHLRGTGGFGAGLRGGNCLDAVAELAGKTTDDLKAELKAGKSIADLLKEYSIDQDQLKAKLQEEREAKLQEMLTNGKITQEQYDQIQQKEEIASAIQEKMAAYQEEIDQLDASQRPARVQEIRKQILQDLLSDGTITQEQYDSMISKPDVQGKFKDRLSKANPGQMLDQMLKNGKISQADYDAFKALEAKMAQEQDQWQNLTPAERRTKMQELRTQTLKELLDAGTITQDQYDQMSAPRQFHGRQGEAK